MTPTLPRTAPEVRSALPGAARTPATGISAGRSDLPYGCRCGARWSGSGSTHCAGGCHLTFSGVPPFDRHRVKGRCVEPSSLGMALVPGRTTEVWGYPQDEAVA